nr:DUF1648 domain-containing protein [Clostridia bacterium]
MKINKTKLLISSIITLLPIPVGLLLYNRLPELVPIHWGADGNADGFAGRTFAVLGMPLILLALHIIAVFVCSLDLHGAGIRIAAASPWIPFWIMPKMWSVYTIPSM